MIKTKKAQCEERRVFVAHRAAFDVRGARMIAIRG
jgi:hypothetical protein